MHVCLPALAKTNRSSRMDHQELLSLAFRVSSGKQIGRLGKTTKKEAFDKWRFSRIGKQVTEAASLRKEEECFKRLSFHTGEYLPLFLFNISRWVLSEKLIGFLEAN